METAEIQVAKEEEIPYEYDLIVVLGANMKKNEKTGRWTLPTILEEDPSKVVGGHSRIIAAKEAYEENLTPFLVAGGVQKDKDTGQEVSRAEVMANLMVDKYQIPKDKIRIVKTASHTLGNAEGVVNFLKSHPELMKRKRIALLTNAYHLPRAKLFFQSSPFFQEEGIQIEPLPAEKMLIRRSKRYKRWLGKLEETPQMTHREEMEKKGIKEFKAGKYKPLNSR